MTLAETPASVSRSRTHQIWQCVGAVSRSFFGIALATAILLVFVASAPAQTWSPGDGYMAATLGGAPVYDTDPGSFLGVPAFDGGAGPNEMGIEAWVNLAPGTADMIGEEVAFGIAELRGAFDQMGMFTTWDGTSHTLRYRVLGGGSPTTVVASTVIAPDTWTHVAGTYTGTTLSAYVNGNETSTAWAGDNGTRVYNTNVLGKVTSGTTTADIDGYLDGQVSGFRVWNTRITPTTTNSPVAFDVSGATGILGNFQIGTNGDTTPLVGSPVGGTMTPTVNAGSDLAYQKNGTGSVTVTADDFFADTIDAGTLAIGNGGAAGALTTDIVDNGTLSFNRSDALTHSNVISGTGIVSQDGNGTLTLSGVNSYTGETQVNAGTLIAANVDALGTSAGGTSVASGATLELASGSPTALTFAENLTLNGGTLSTSDGGSTVLTGTVALGSDSQIAPSATTEMTIDGVVSGAGGFTFNGLSLVLGATNTYDGATIIGSGNLFVAADGALGSTTGGTTVNSGGALRIDDVVYTAAEAVTLNGGSLDSSGANSSFAGSVAVAADSAINVINNEPFTISGAVTGSSALEIGAESGFGGTLILTGANTYSGAATITRGTVQIGSGGTSGDFTPSGVANEGTLTFNRSDAISASYAISGTGAVNQNGSGTLTLSGANTYTGDTNVNAGTLSLTGSLTSDVIVGSNGILAGSGLSTGSLSGAGSVDPGSSPGILSFASLDGSAGTSFNFEFTAADPTYSNASSSANDVLRLTDATTPFTSALTSSSTVNIYLNVDSHSFGDEYRGGFFTDLQSDFLASVQDATFAYYLKDASGTVAYNGVNYRNITGNPGDWILTTVPATADFAGGTVNGQVLQVVPEPSSIALAGFAIAGLAAAGYRRRRAAAAAASTVAA